jgi:ABC-2 type transport system permease protein
MSKEPETPPPAAASPDEPKTEVQTIRRGRIGLNVTIQIILGVVLFALVNVAGFRNYRQWDYTYSRSFSLGENTEKFLREVKTPVKITVLAPQGHHLEKDMTPLLDQYERVLKDRLEVSFIDTQRDTNAWQQFQIELNKNAGGFKPPGEQGVFVQALVGQTGDSGNKQNFFRWIGSETVFVTDKEQQVPIAFRGESLLNTAIAAVTNPERPKVAYVAGINRQKFVAGQTYFNTFKDICSSQNIDLEPWLIMDDAEYAPAYRSLIIAAPNLLGAQQDEELTSFLETPGNSVMILLDPLDGSPEMDTWLAKYGIQPQKDVVLWARSTAGGPEKEYTVDAYFKENSPITAGIEDRPTLLPGSTRSLKLLTDLEKVRQENIDLVPLLAPGRDFWGETKYQEALPVLDPKEDNGPPLIVAASAERGAGGDPRLQLQSSRLVVIGNAEMSLPPALEANHDFLTRSLNWMLHRTETAPNDTSTGKLKHRFRISMKPEQGQRVFLICTVVLPLSMLMLGLVIWSTRRN